MLKVLNKKEHFLSLTFVLDGLASDVAFFKRCELILYESLATLFCMLAEEHKKIKEKKRCLRKIRSRSAEKEQNDVGKWKQEHRTSTKLYTL